MKQINKNLKKKLVKKILLSYYKKLSNFMGNLDHFCDIGQILFEYNFWFEKTKEVKKN